MSEQEEHPQAMHASATIEKAFACQTLNHFAHHYQNMANETWKIAQASTEPCTMEDMAQLACTWQTRRNVIDEVAQALGMELGKKS